MLALLCRKSPVNQTSKERSRKKDRLLKWEQSMAECYLATVDGARNEHVHDKEATMFQ